MRAAYFENLARQLAEGALGSTGSRDAPGDSACERRQVGRGTPHASRQGSGRKPPWATTFTSVLIAVVTSWLISFSSFAAEQQVGYAVIYSGGSLPSVKGGQELKLYIDSSHVRLTHKGHEVANIPVSAIKEVSYAQGAPREAL